MGRWLTGLLDRILVAISAISFAQLPLFMQQYQQQLLGHVAELHIQVNAIEDVAKAGGKTLSQYTQRFISSGDVDFINQGEFIKSLYERSLNMAQSSQSLLQAGPFEKPLLFFKYLQWDVATSTFHHFQPGIPISTEGLLYGFLGILFGYGLCLSIRRLLAMTFQMFKKSDKNQMSIS